MHLCCKKKEQIKLKISLEDFCPKRQKSTLQLYLVPTPKQLSAPLLPLSLLAGQLQRCR